MATISCTSVSVGSSTYEGANRSISMSYHYRIRAVKVYFGHISRDSISRYRLNAAIRFRPIKHLRKWNAIDTRPPRPLLQVKFAIKNGFRINNGSIERDIFSSWRDNGKSSVSATFSAQPVTAFLLQRSHRFFNTSPPLLPPLPPLSRDIRATNLPSYRRHPRVPSAYHSYV